MATDPSIDMTGEEALRVMAEIRQLNHRILIARERATGAAEAAKEAKAHVNTLQDELSELIRRSSESLTDKPLFASVEPTAPSSLQVEIADAWKAEPITVLELHGATAKDVEKLIEADVTTLGHLANITDLTAIKGIGPKAAERISDAAAAYHASNCNQGEDPESDDDDCEHEPSDESQPAEMQEEAEFKTLKPYLIRFTKARKQPVVLWAVCLADAEDYAVIQFELTDGVTELAVDDVPEGARVERVPPGYSDLPAQGEPIAPEDESQEPAGDE